MRPDPRYASPGAIPAEGGTSFTVWAPNATRLDLHIVDPYDKVIPMERGDDGYARASVDGLGPGARYRFRFPDGSERPDPASRSQPDGVHEASEVRSPDFAWSDGSWAGVDLPDLVVYEAHIGTLTPDGTFDAAIGVLPELVDLGVTALEVMPVAQFPGGRNWGYDGVLPYAPQSTYGGPDGFKRLVDACHANGIAVVLDVVYNHLGPEGNYLDAFGPYFTDRYATPWGRAINFDGPGSDEVRRYFIGNALYWFDEFHVDALRLDAVHAIADPSALPFIEELAIATETLTGSAGRKHWLIAESSANDSRIIAPREHGGYGLDAQWNDDFHHALYTLITGQRDGYFVDYGEPADLARALREGYVYQGEYSAFRGRRHGRSSAGAEPYRFVTFANNHDQIGNRALGDRLSTRVPEHDLRLMAATVLLSAGVPLLFQGEEYAETAPFIYFVSHSDPDLVEAVRRGRRAEFEGFSWEGEVPDPQDEATFAGSKLDRALASAEPHATIRRVYGELLAIRRDNPVLRRPHRRDAHADGALVVSELTGAEHRIIVLMNFAGTEAVADLGPGTWELLFDSDAAEWNGSARSRLEGCVATVAPRSASAYRSEVA